MDRPRGAADHARVDQDKSRHQGDEPVSGGSSDLPLGVILVENNDTFRAALAAFLEANGFAVLATTGQGSEAVELVRRLAPDVVILDQRLGDTTGLAVAHALKRSPTTTAIVLHTSRPPEPEAARDAGVREVILKRGSPTGLLDALRVIAEERSRRPPIA